MKAFFARHEKNPQLQVELSAELRQRALAYLMLRSNMSLELNHESVLGYLPDHMRCEILLAQHR